MSKVFEFNGRPFLLKADKVLKSEKRIYELLAQSKHMISYPYEVETTTGERITSWRSLSDQEVCALHDESDNRPLVDRVSWEGTSDYFIREYGVPAVVKRIAPVAHLVFQCSIIDEYMAASTYAMPMPIEDYVYLTRWVMNSPDYDVKVLQKTRPDLYARITDNRRLPRIVQSSSLILLTSAEQIASKLAASQESEGDEVYDCEHEDGSLSHICMEVTDYEIILRAQTATIDDIENNGLLFIKNTDKFKMCTGAYTPTSLMRAIGTMYSGLEADLKHIAEYCNRERIDYELQVDES